MRNRKVEILMGRIAAAKLTAEEVKAMEERHKAKTYVSKDTVPMSPRQCSKRERELVLDAKLTGGAEARSTRIKLSPMERLKAELARLQAENARLKEEQGK